MSKSPVIPSRFLSFAGVTFLAAALAGCSGVKVGGGAADPDTDGGSSSGATTDPGDTGDASSAGADGGTEVARAPDFGLQTLDGDFVSLSDFKGKKVVLIDFWATTCDPCLAEMPELVELYEKKKDLGFEVLAIATDGSETQAAVSATVSKFNMPFPILLDPETEVMDLYNPKGILPFTVIVDRNGGMVFTRASFQAGDTKAMESLEAEVDAALAKK